MYILHHRKTKYNRQLTSNLLFEAADGVEVAETVAALTLDIAPAAQCTLKPERILVVAVQLGQTLSLGEELLVLPRFQTAIQYVVVALLFRHRLVIRGNIVYTFLQ